MTLNLNIQLNGHHLDEWDDEFLNLSVYKNYIVVSHSYPITPWKSNYDTVLYLDEQDARRLSYALIEAVEAMGRQEESYLDTD